MSPPPPIDCVHFLSILTNFLKVSLKIGALFESPNIELFELAKETESWILHDESITEPVATTDGFTIVGVPLMWNRDKAKNTRAPSSLQILKQQRFQKRIVISQKMYWFWISWEFDKNLGLPHPI